MYCLSLFGILLFGSLIFVFGMFLGIILIKDAK